MQVIHQRIVIGLCGHFTDLWGVRLFEVTVLPECSDCCQRPSWQSDHPPAGGNRSYHQELAHDNGHDRGEELAFRVQVVQVVGVGGLGLNRIGLVQVKVHCSGC